MVKTKKKEVQKQGLRPSQKAKAEKLLKKQAAKKAAADLLSVNENEVQGVVSATESETQPSLSATTKKKTRAKVAISITKDKKIVRRAASTTTKKTTRTTAKKSTEEEQPQVKENAEALATITVKNAEGDPDTIAEILIQNKIDYTPKVSVIIPVYNVELYLRECLDSVINQTLKEIEIICVDDGSTDSSLEILKEYAKKDNRITVITQKNLYAGVARNAGLAVAKGEYLSFLDSDDFFEPTLFEETYNLAEKEQSQIVFYQYKNYDNDLQRCDENPRGISKRLTNEEHITVTTSSLKENLFTLCNPMPWNKLIKHSLAVGENLHYQALKASNDVCFSLNILACAEKITLYYKSLVYYRHNRRDSLKNTRDKTPLNFYEAYKGIYNTLTSKGLYEKYKKTFLTSLVSSCLWTLCNTDEKHQLVKDFIKDVIIPQYIQGNENLLDSSLFTKLQRVYYPDIIVSLTSYPARINTINQTIETLLNQSMKADKVILWLAPEQFSNKEADLPQELLNLKDKGLTIDWYHDVRSYKKLIPTLKKYPEAIVITADDDLLFNWNLVYLLFKSYIESPNFVHCHRITRMYNYADGSLKILPRNLYLDEKKKYIHELCSPSAFNKLSGGAGTLFPPHCFADDICNEELFMKLAPTSDDIWFWLMALLNGYRVKVVEDNVYELKYVEGTQDVGLFNVNDINGNKIFYEHLNNIIDYFPQLNKAFATDKRQNDNLIEKLTIKDIENKAIQLRKWYQKVHHKSLNLSNPRSFNEKIQWQKLYESTPIKTLLADKYLVRDWVKGKIGEQYLIPLLGVYDSFEEIDFDKLPDKFVIKCNHGSGYNIIVKNKSELNLQDTKEKLDKWMAEDFSKRAGIELHYRDIPHKIIIEKYMDDGTGDLRDYKYTCFDGKPEFIWIDSDRHTEHKRNLYDLEWQQLQCKVNSHYNTFPSPEKPHCLKEMNQLAAILSKEFSYVRVDFYIINEKIYFGEMTFTSSSGTEDIKPDSFEKYLAEKIRLPKQAYNIDTGTYYSLPFDSIIKKYTLFPYYLWKNKLLRKKYRELLVESIKPQILVSRIDIKNKGVSSNGIVISSENAAQILYPTWLADKQGIGQIIQYNQIYNKYSIKVIGNGKLSIDFRGQDKRCNEERIQLWADYKSIKIDGNEILSEPIATWVSKPYHYEMYVRDGQEIILEVEQQYHEYTENELKDVLLKLNPDNDYICENIDVIITEMKKYFPVMDEQEYKKRQMASTISEIMADLTSYRLDIKNFGAENNRVEVIATTGRTEEAKWLTNEQGIGIILQDNAISNVIKIKAINDGNLMLSFRGQDKRFENKRFPLWIDYKSIKIDGNEILSKPVATWHGRPYIYEMSVKNGQEITLVIEQQYHKYTKQELENILPQLCSDDEFIKENIDEIVEKILANIDGGYLESKINDYPQITADCFIPIGEACRVANWLRNYHLRYCSLPFDWLGGCSLNFIMKSIKYGISDWFNEYIEDPSKANKKCHFVYDTKNNFRSRHAFPLDKTVKEYMPEFKELFGRRYDRLIELIKEAQNICFVCNNRPDSVYDFYLFIREMQKIYPNKKYKLLHIHHNDDKREIVQYQFSDDITVYNIEAHDIHKNGNDKSNPRFWIGNEDLWNEVCSHLSLSDSVKTKLEEENKDKDSAA